MYGEIVKKLIEAAKLTMQNSYSIYSEFKVGAAVLADNGKIYSGTNIENASYGLTMCAERTAIFTAVSDGAKKIEFIVLVSEQENIITPCGACRQVILEFCDKNTKIIAADKNNNYKVFHIEELLPFAFELKK